jgi:acetolactate synthase I/II/III large subunit
MDTNERTGGRVLVDQLRLHGAELVFGVPGESYLAALDAMHDVPEVRYVVCRQEGGAAMMADAYGRLTGRPGIAFATRGPGATNAGAGVHVAQQDSTPMILLVGQIARGTAERDAFQEVDYRRLFGGMAKWVAQVEDAARLPEFLHRAFMTATSGRPGPVVLSLPEDVLAERTGVADGRPWRRAEAAPSPAALASLRRMLEEARRPFVVLGGGGWDERACADLARFLAANELPAAAGFRRQDLLDNEHPSYAGDIAIAPNPRLAERIRDADLLIAIGTRLSEMTTQGYTLLGIPLTAQRLVHAHNDPEELGRVYQPELAIQAGMGELAAALAAMPPLPRRPWAEATRAARADYLAWRDGPAPNAGSLQMAEVVRHVRERLPEDGIVCNGAGNYNGWVNRFFPYRGFRTQLAPVSGSMGYGLPAAIAAKLARPRREVVAFAGDGCFLMTGQELATAVQYGLRLTVLVVNNGMYGTIRMHQEREHPGRVIGTGLRNPDFAAYARAFGAFGARAATAAEFRDAFGEATAQDGPALIELMLDPEAITPRTTITELRERALAAAGRG